MLFVVGETGRVHFQSKGIRIDQEFQYTAQNPTLHRARKIASRMLELYAEKEVDEVYILYTRLNSTVSMEPIMEQLLPLTAIPQNQAAMNELGAVKTENFELIPSAEDIIDSVVPSYLTGFIYGALRESYCCEHNARMLAMDAANKNGADMLQKLNMQYNRSRQAKITQDITEVSAGARAQRK